MLLNILHKDSSRPFLDTRPFVRSTSCCPYTVRVLPWLSSLFSPNCPFYGNTGSPPFSERVFVAGRKDNLNPRLWLDYGHRLSQTEARSFVFHPGGQERRNKKGRAADTWGRGRQEVGEEGRLSLSLSIREAFSSLHLLSHHLRYEISRPAGTGSSEETDRSGIHHSHLRIGWRI